MDAETTMSANVAWYLVKRQLFANKTAIQTQGFASLRQPKNSVYAYLNIFLDWCQCDVLFLSTITLIYCSSLQLFHVLPPPG